MTTDHPDPLWFKRLEIARLHGQNDICSECGHCRFLHGMTTGCFSPSTSLVDSRPCMCPLHAADPLFRLPSARCLRPTSSKETP